MGRLIPGLKHRLNDRLNLQMVVPMNGLLARHRMLDLLSPDAALPLSRQAADL
jgi:hypothetical protein